MFDSPCDPVLSAALYVESNQVEPSLPSVEQVVLDVVHKAAVKPDHDDQDYKEEIDEYYEEHIDDHYKRRRRITFDCYPW